MCSWVLKSLIFISPAVTLNTLKSMFESDPLKEKVRVLLCCISLLYFMYFLINNLSLCVSRYIQMLLLLWVRHVLPLSDHIRLSLFVLLTADEVSVVTIIFIRFFSFCWSAGLWSARCPCTHCGLLQMSTQVWRESSEAGRLIFLNYFKKIIAYFSKSVLSFGHLVEWN